MKYRVPAHITAPYATRLGGEWQGRKSAAAAWRAAYAYARKNPGGRQLIVTREGDPVPPPETKPRPSGPSGESFLPRFSMRMEQELIDRLDAEARRRGISRSELIRVAVVRELDSQSGTVRE
jgi:hypothetical protein